MTYKRNPRNLNGQMKQRKPSNTLIKELLISPPVLKAPTHEGLFRLESHTSCEGV